MWGVLWRGASVGAHLGVLALGVAVLGVWGGAALGRLWSVGWLTPGHPAHPSLYYYSELLVWQVLFWRAGVQQGLFPSDLSHPHLHCPPPPLQERLRLHQWWDGCAAGEAWRVLSFGCVAEKQQWGGEASTELLRPAPSHHHELQT